MNLIVLSGGSGKRLWPLSNDARSKQFLRLLKDKDGKPCSMVQRVFQQIQQAGITGNIVISTSESQLESIRSQLGQSVDVVLEPERRNTYPAIALACSHLYYNRGVQLEDIVTVLPVDPYAQIEYFTTLYKLNDVVANDMSDIALMGVKPTFPTEKYGYIIPQAEALEGEIVRVKAFKEKPSEEAAQKLIDEGALWNCGVFAFKLGYIMDLVHSAIHGVQSYQDVLQRYGELKKDSFDYEVVEKCNSIAAVGYEGYWKDLGTWNTLTEEIEAATSGNVITDSETANTHIINELGLPVVVLGAKNMIIAASYDGILIADKHQSSYMKPLVEKIEQRPMYEEKRWGEYRVVDFVRHENGTLSLTKRLYMNAGKELSYQVHRHRKEVWTITKGEGELTLNGEKRIVKQGDVVDIPIGVNHMIKALTDLEFIEVQIGDMLEEGDIERLEKI